MNTHRTIVIAFSSLDGVTQDPDGRDGTPNGGWAFRHGPEAVAGDKFGLGPILNTGVIVYGRKTWEAFSRVWPNRSDDFSAAMNRIPKLVATSTAARPQRLEELLPHRGGSARRGRKAEGRPGRGHHRQRERGPRARPAGPCGRVPDHHLPDDPGLGHASVRNRFGAAKPAPRFCREKGRRRPPTLRASRLDDVMRPVAITRAPEPRRKQMARMVVIWRRPKDTRSFDEHYFGTHVPLAKKLPGLREYAVSSGPIAILNGAHPTPISSRCCTSIAWTRSSARSPAPKARPALEIASFLHQATPFRRFCSTTGTSDERRREHVEKVTRKEPPDEIRDPGL